MQQQARTGGESADQMRTTRTWHTQMVAKLIERHPEAKTTGFMRALAGCGDYMADILKNDPDWRADVAIVPDAYMIDHAHRFVLLLEVVDTSDLTRDKLEKIQEIGWALDQDWFSIAVVRVDRHGQSIQHPLSDGLAEIEAEIARLSGGKHE